MTKEQIASSLMAELANDEGVEADARKMYRSAATVLDMAARVAGKYALDWSELSESTRARWKGQVIAGRQAQVAAVLEALGLHEQAESIGKELQ